MKKSDNTPLDDSHEQTEKTPLFPKEYTPPVLTKYGTVADLTQDTFTAGVVDPLGGSTVGGG